MIDVRGGYKKYRYKKHMYKRNKLYFNGLVKIV